VTFEQRRDRAARELKVGFVHDDDAARRVKQTFEVILCDAATGRVVGRAEDGHVGPLALDGRAQRLNVKAELTVERHAQDIAAQDGSDLPVEREGRLRDEHAPPFADRHHQRRLYQLVRPVARDHAVRAPAREGRQLLVQRRGHEVRVTRPRAALHPPKRLAPDLLGRVPGALVLVELHGAAVGLQCVSLERADLRLDSVERVRHPSLFSRRV
jgi:hypothetical protein